MNVENSSELSRRIGDLKREKSAVILAHYYTTPEVQAVADFLGDSLALSIEAQKVEARTILFAGVHFMAETAKVLCPDKKARPRRSAASAPATPAIRWFRTSIRRWRSRRRPTSAARRPTP